MPENPERDIEKQLREHAEARRAAAGEPALHPVNRRLLQDAVRQQWGGGAGGAARPWFAGLWPRVAFALGLLILLGGVAVMFVPKSKSPVGELAKLKAENPTAQSAIAENAPEATQEIVANSAVMSDETETRKQARALRVAESIARGNASQDRAAAKPAPMVASPAADSRVPAPSVAEPFLFSRREDKDAAQRTRMSSEATGGWSGEVAVRLSGAVPIATLATNQASTLIFTNVTLLSYEWDTPVLAQFSVSQAGNSVTVVDRDGSIYRGTGALALTVATLGHLPTTTLAGSGRVAGESGHSASVASTAPAHLFALQNTGAPPNAASAPSQLADAQAWSFTVEGTNRTLRQRVVFTGNLFQNVVPGGTSQNAVNLQNEVNAAPFINGRVTIGSKPAAEVNAQAVMPP